MTPRRSLCTLLSILSLSVTLAACGDDDPAPADPSGSGASGSGGQATGGAAGEGGGGGEATCPAGSHPAAGGCEATFAGWTDGPALLQERDHHITFIAVADGAPFLYAAGGVVDNMTLLDSIESAPIQPDGSLGTWASTSKLPAVAAGSGVAVVGTTVVVTGGFRTTATGNPTLSSATDVGKVMPDGTIGAWTAGPKLGRSRFHHAMVVSGSTLYVLGGLTGDNKDNIPDVERADVASDGTVGAWTQVTSLPTKLSHHGAAIFDGAIYVTGGLEGDPAGAHVDKTDVLRAPILDDGSLGEWSVVGQLPDTLATHASFVHAGALYVMGGVEGGSENTAAVRRAPIGADGTIGAWEDLAPLPKPRAHAHQSPLHEGFVYAVAGALHHASMPDVFIGKFE